MLQEEDDRQEGVYQQCTPLAQVKINYGKGTHKKEEHKHDSGRQDKYIENPDQYDSFNMVLEEIGI